MSKLSALVALVFWLHGAGVTAASPKKVDNSPLLRLIFPGVDRDGAADKSIVIRSVSGDYDPAPLEGEMTVDVFDSLSLSNGTHQDRLLVIDVSHKDDSAHQWGGETLLALIRLKPKPHLLDVVDVRADRETYFWKKLSALHHDAVIVNATHLNASEEYVLLNLVEVKHDKFVLSKVDFPLIFSSKLGSSSLSEVPTLKVIRKPGAESAVFAVKVTAAQTDPDTQAVKSSQSKTFSSQLKLVNGSWQCFGCGAMSGGMVKFEKRFNFEK